MLGDKVTIISTIFLVGALFSIGMTGDASALPVTVDGVIVAGEYANFVVVDKTPDLGGVYAPGTSGSFAGGPTGFGHGDWTLYWDSSPTDLFFAAESIPPASLPSHPGESSFGIHLLQILGDPNLGIIFTDCTGTAYFPFFANGGHRAFGCPPNPGFENTLFGGSLPPSSTDTVFQIPVGSIINPIEWSMVRADLDHFSGTAYTGNLQCLWFQISAFDSRSVSNSGDGVKTIWLKLDPNTPNCGEEAIQVDIDIKPGSNPSSVSCNNTKGTVPVAIFGSANFDVSTIDLSSLELNGVEVTEKHTTIHIENLNDDGFDDAVLHLDKAGVCAATSDDGDYPLKESADATLTGSNADGDFEGTGDIRIVKR